MISPFGMSTPSSTPVVENPFAPTTTNASGRDGSISSVFGAKTVPKNPFAQDDTTPSNANAAPNPFAPTPKSAAVDSGKDKRAAKAAWGKQLNGAQTSFGLGKNSDVNRGGFADAVSKFKQNLTPGIGQTAGDVSASSDHARKVYEQLQKDNIRPPAWPSNPGDPKNKGQMAKFREQYEDYRSKVRASLTRAGLIDDPSKRKKLQHAIEFRGICEDMCPDYEKITRITEHDIPTPEKDPQTLVPSTSRMVKKLARSAAGQEAPLPMDVLSVPTLRKTLNYLIDDLLRADENLPVLHGYLWDRTRAIRRDFTFFSSLNTEEIKVQASVLEDIVRFHVTALHLLSQTGKVPEDFVEQQELEQLGKALLTLRDIYDDCNALGSPCKNEAEFRSYYLVFHAYDPNILEIVQRQWRPSLWRESDVIRTAVSLVEALQNTSDFHGPLREGPSLAASGSHSVYFRIVEDPKVSYTMACFAECHFPSLRRSILRNVNRALARPKEAAHDVTATDLNKFLRFDTVQEAIEFAELHGLKFQPNAQNPSDRNMSCVILHSRSQIPHLRLSHQFSQKLVESKRGSRSLPEILHNTVFADSSTTVEEKALLANEGSLFVQDEAPPASKSMPPPPARNPFARLGRPHLNGDGATNHFEKASASFAEQVPKPNPPVNQVTLPTKQSTAAFIASNDAKNARVERPNTALNPSEATRPKLSFSNIMSTKTETAPVEKTLLTTEGSQWKPTFGFAKTGATELANSAAVGAIAPNNTAAPPSFGFFAPKPTDSPPAQPPEIPQKSLPAFSGFPSQKQVEKPQESAKIQTPPTSPAQPIPTAEVAANKSFSQPDISSSVNGPNAAVINSASTPTPSLPLAELPTVSEAGASNTTTRDPVVPPKPPPSRDKLLDFTKWFVEGDNGLMSEFQYHYLESLLNPLFVEWQQKAAEKRRLEEEARDNAIADEFRQRCLSVNYFYRWKSIAREKRLSYVRRSGREQLKQFYQSQQLASRIPKATPSKPRLEVSPNPRPKREQALVESLRESQAKKQRLLPQASRNGAGLANDAAAAIGRHFNLPMPRSGMTSPTRSRSSSMSKEGSKTRALREELLGKGAGTARFRRSLPSVTSSARDASADSMRSSSRVSERWRLKAMGIVQLPDGTAVPESLMNDRRFNSCGRPHRALSNTSFPSRRPSITSIIQPPPPPPPQILHTSHHSPPTVALDDGAGNKRKRASEDGDDDSDGGLLLGQNGDLLGHHGGHKRVMSDAENLVKELRALREEMEEGTLWFKSQNERLCHEISSRGGTPMDECI